MFRTAKTYLWDGQGMYQPSSHDYICCAISDAYYMGGASATAVAHATSVIRARLGSFTRVESWLVHVTKVDVSQLRPANVQAYRHRWLDALIKEFSK